MFQPSFVGGNDEYCSVKASVREVRGSAESAEEAIAEALFR